MWGVKHSRSSSVSRQLRRKRDPRRSEWRRRFALELLENRHLLAGLIYFSLDSQIRSVPAGGGEEQVLFAGDEPRISPDGRWLAYRRDTADESHQRGLWLYDLETEKRFNAQTTSSSITTFSFTPDSQQLVLDTFWGSSWSQSSLYTLTVDRLFQSPVIQSNVRAPNVNPVDGSIAVQYSSYLSILEEGSLTRTDIVTTGTNLRPVWSADGQWISFVRRMTSSGPLELHKVRRDGSELQKLSSATGDFAVSLLERGATWSPDGQLLYVGGSVGGVPGIYAIPTDGSLADGSIQPELIHETPTVPNHVSAYFDPSLVSVGTTLSLDASPETSQFGESVTFTAMVTADSGTQLPTGQVDFFVNQFHTGSAPVVDGVAEWTTQLMAGLHEVRARFLPDNSSFSFSSDVTGHNVRSAALTAESRLAYELNGDLHITALDGSSDTVIRSGSAPRVSPNGRYVAFLINNNLIARDLQTDVQWIVGSSSRPVFAWSNDSRSLYWQSTSSSWLYETAFDSQASLRFMNTSDDGPSVNPSDGRLVLTGNTGLAIRSPDLLTRVVVPNTQAGDSWPVWSPDGQWILFSRWGSSLNAFSGFYKIRPDGSDLTQLTDDAVKPANRDSATAVWSLDGNYILYGGRSGNQSGIYRFSAEPAEPAGPFQAELFLETVGGIPRHVSTPRPPQAPLVDTHLTLTSSDNPVAYGETVTYTATLSTANGIPSGVVTFRIGENSRFDVPLDSNGQAVLTVPVPLPGSDNLVRAEFQPSSEFAYSTSFVNQRVLLSDSLAAGPKVAFSVGTRVYVANANGSGVMFLTNGFQPKMSPDGRYVAFRSPSGSSSYQNASPMVRDLQTHQEWQVFGTWSTFDFDWTASNQLVFDSPGWGSVLRINADGSGLTTLRSSLQGRSIAVNPIDQQIALHSSSGSYPGIWLVNQDGTGLVRAPGTQAGDQWPSWSPEGEWLTFIRGSGTEQAVYKIRTDGSELTRLSDPSVLQLSGSIPVGTSLPKGSQAVWADGDYLLVSGIVDGAAGIYRLAGDGSEVVNLEIASGSLVNTVGPVAAEWQQVAGETITWTNASGGNWSTASNWSSGRVPGPGDHVVIPDLGAAGANLTITFSGPSANVASVTTAENLELTGGNLVISGHLSGPGLIFLRGGQLTGASIASGTTVRATSSTSTIDGLTVNGTIEMTAGALTLRNGVEIGSQGRILMDNGYNLNLEGSQRISGTGQIIDLQFGSINGSGSSIPPVLVIDSGMRYYGRNGSLRGTNLTVVNHGVIEANSGTSSTEMTLRPAKLVNYGTLRASGGGRLLVDAVQWENHGQIISAAGSSLGFGGSFATPSIAGRVSEGGLFYLSGVLENRNHELNLTATTGPLSMRNGTIVGGVINTEGTNELVVDTSARGNLDTLVLNGTGRTVTGAGPFRIWNDLELNGSLLFDGGGINFHGNFSHQSQRVRTSSTGNLTGTTSSASVYQSGINHTVTFDEGITLTSMTSFSGASGGQPATWVNKDTIRTGSRSISFDSNSRFINETSGTWQVDGTSSTTFTINGLWENRGSIKLTSGQFVLRGTFAQPDVGNVVREGGTLAFNGRLLGDLTLDETTGPWNLNGGELVNSVITSAFPLIKETTSTLTLNRVTISEDTRLFPVMGFIWPSWYDTVSIVNGIVIDGELAIGSGTSRGSVNLIGSQAIGGTGAIVGGTSTSNSISIGSNATVTFADTLAVRGGNLSVSGGGTTVFYGLLQPDVSGGTISWGTNFQNYGHVQPVNGSTVRFNGSHFTNYSTVNVTAGNTVRIEPTTFTNAAEGIIQATGGTLQLGRSGLTSGPTLNLGTIEVANATVELGGTFEQADFGTADPDPGQGTFIRTADQPGTVTLVGNLINDLTLDEITGSWSYGGSGSLKDSTIRTSAGVTFSSKGSFTFDNVVIPAVEQIVHDSGSLWLKNGLLLQGVLNIGSESTWQQSYVYFDGTQTISGSGQILSRRPQSVSSSHYNQGYFSGTNTVVTFGPELTIRGGGWTVGSGGTSIFKGLLQPDVAGQTIQWSGNIENHGLIEPINGATVDFVGNSFTNFSSVNVSAGNSVQIESVTFTNTEEGIITATGGRLNLGRSPARFSVSNGPSMNSGRIEVSNSTVELGGTFEQADFGAADPAPGQGTFIRSADHPGTVTLVGNMIGDLTLDSVTGSWFYGGSGTLKDSTIRTSDGVTFSSSGSFTFDNVVIPAEEIINHNIGTLFLKNGLQLEGLLYIGSETTTASLWFDGTQTIGGSGEIVSRRPQSGSSNNSGGFSGTNPVVTFGPDLTVRGGGWTVSSGSSGRTINLQGLLQPDVAGQTITFNNDFLNYGHIEPLNGSSLSFEGSVFANHGTIDVTESNTVRIQPTTFTNAAEGTIHASGGTLQLGRSGVSGTLGPTRNFGRIEFANTVVELGGTFVQSDFGVPNPEPGQGTFIRSADQPGTVRLIGTLNGDLTLDHVTGMWEVGNGGGLVNSTVIIQGLPTSEILSSGTVRLENVTIPSDVTWTQISGNLLVRNGLTVDGVLRTSATGSYQITPENSLTIDGSGELLATGTLFFWVPQNNTTVVFGPELTLRGRNMQFLSSFTDWNTSYVLQGLLQAEVAGGRFTFIPSWTTSHRSRTFVNQGVVSAINGGLVVIDPTEFINQGLLSVGENSTISVQPNVFHNLVDVSSIRPRHFSARLTGGSYSVDQGTLRLSQGNDSSVHYLITTLDADVALSGSTARIYANSSSSTLVESLSELSTIMPGGSLRLSNGQQLMPRGTLSIEGTVEVDGTSILGGFPNSPISTNGLVTYLAANGNSLDSLGDNHAALMNGAGYTEGFLGQAFLLDGADDFVAISDDPSLRNSAFTVQGWFRLDSNTSGTRYLFSKPLGNGGLSYGIWLSGSSLRVGIGSSSHSAGQLSVGEWTHVAMIVEPSGNVRVLVNGSETRYWWPGQLIQFDDQPHLIGAAMTNGNAEGFFHGAIDEVQYHNRPLSAEEISIYHRNSLIARAYAGNEIEATTNGLISYLPASGNAVDSFGNNSGVLMNGTSFTQGISGQAFLMNGTNNYVSIADSPSLRNDSFTIEGWFRMDQFSSGGVYSFFAKPFGSATNTSYAMELYGGSLWVEVGNSSSKSGSYVGGVSIGSSSIGVWNHVAMTLDATGRVRVFFNGVQRLDWNSGRTIAYDNNPHLIGAQSVNGSLTRFFPGAIDEVRYYNRVLSADEIQANYLQPLVTRINQVAGQVNINGVLRSQVVYTLTGGTLYGEGTLPTNLNHLGGTVAPGNSPGCMTIDGDYTQATSAILQIELEGTEVCSQYDRLTVSGAVSLAGQLEVVLAPGYTPAVGSQFLILQNDGVDPIQGVFDDLLEREIVIVDGDHLFQITYVGGDGNDIVLTYLGQGVVVTNANPSGPGSLSQAILDTNAKPGEELVAFAIRNIHATGGVYLLDDDLPTITDAVIIDGTTQSDYFGSPRIERRGSGLGSGLVFGPGSEGSQLVGLSITGWQAGVQISTDNVQLAHNWIGLETDGATTRGNAYGVLLDAGSSGSTIGGSTPEQRNVISGNTTAGLWIDGGQSNTILGNWIGTDVSGQTVIGNGPAGVLLSGGATGNVIGDASGTAVNVIVGDQSTGVLLRDVSTTGNAVAGNWIGLTVDGQSTFAGVQLARGVAVENAVSNFVGRDGSALVGNWIGGAARGISIEGDDSLSNIVRGNVVGLSPVGSHVIANQVGIVVDGASSTVVGGVATGQANTISGNTVGIRVLDGSQSTLISGNRIGFGITDAATAPGNQQSGIELLGGLKTVVTDNRIVSSGTAGTYAGIQVGDVPAVLRRNLISASSGESISTLSSPGVIELTQARVDGFVLGRILSATPNTTFTVDFYSAPQPGEALQYIGSSAVLTDDLGMSEFEISGLGDIPPTWYLSATITGPRTEGSDDLSTSPHSNGVIPQAAIIRGLPERGSEGTPVNLKAFAISGSVAGFSVTGYRWDITKDGLAYASGGEAGIQFSPDDQGEYQVVLTLILTNDVGEQRLEILGPHTMQIQNVAPTPQFEVTPNSLKIGQPVILVSTSSDPGLLDVLSYAWVIRSGSLQGQIVFEQADSTDGQTATIVPDSGGIYYATLTVDDQDGGVRSLTRQFQVAGLPSSLSISAPTSGSEGQTVRARAPEDLLQRVEEVDFTWTVIKNPVAIGPSQQVPFTVPSEGVIEFTPDDDGLYRILLSASDETGLITADPIDVVVTNTSPVVAIQGGNIEASISQPVTFTALVTDPGTADTHVVDWVVLRNGVPVAQAANGGLLFTFTPTAGGVYVVRATATDDDYDAVTGTGRGVGQTVLYVAESPIGISLDYSPGPYAEGDPVSFAPVVPAGVTVVSYEWLARDSRGYQVAAQSGTLQSGEEVPEFDFAPRQGGRYMITLNVILSDSRSSTVYSDILEVAGTAPVIDTLSVISPLGIVREGAEVIVRASASDDREPVGLSYAWEILKPGAAEWISMDSRTGRPSDLLFVPDNDGPYEVRVTVADTQGLWAQLGLTVNVANVAPEVRLGITQQIGNIITFEALATDPSSEDAANLTYAWSTDGTNFTGFSSSPVFSVDVNQLGSVLVVAVSDDTETTTMQSFILKGSAGNDVVTITAANSSAAAASGADQIVYLALDGNDSITVDGSVSLPVTILGGAGDDTLDASAAMVPVVLDGGSGNDVLRGGAGDDVLVAGPGTNWLFGGQGNNLFIGGGNDTMTGGSGDDTYRVHFSDVVINDIQGGYNTIDLSGVPQAVTLDFGQTDGTPQPVFSGSTLALNGSFDLLIGTAFSDTLHAGNDGTELRGGGGNDQLSASAQGVILDAGEGDNTLILQGASGLFRGGIGRDTFIGTLGTLGTSYLHLGDGDDVVAVSGPSGGLAPVFISAGSGENDIEVTRVTGTIYDGFGSDSELTEFGTTEKPTRSRVRAIISSDISIFGTAAGSEISVLNSQDIAIFGGGGDSVELSDVSQALLDGSLFGAATPNQPFTATLVNSSDVSIFGSAVGGQSLTATMTASSEISIFGSAVSNSISVLSGSDISIFGVAEGSIVLGGSGQDLSVVGASIHISEFGSPAEPGEPVAVSLTNSADIGIFGSATASGRRFTATVVQSSEISIFGSASGGDGILVLSSQDVAIFGIVSGDIQLGPELSGSGDGVANVIIQMSEFGTAVNHAAQLSLLVNNSQDVSIFGSAGSSSAALNATIVNSSDIGIFGSASGGQISVVSSQEVSIFGQGSDAVSLSSVVGGNVFTQTFGSAQPSGALIVNVAENSGDIGIFGSASRRAVVTVTNSSDIQIFGGTAISPDGQTFGDTILLEGVSGALVAAGVFGTVADLQAGDLPTVMQLQVSANSSDLEIFGTAAGKSRVTVTASQDISIFSGYGDEIALVDAERVRIEGGRFGAARVGRRGLVASVVGNSSEIAIFGTDTSDQVDLLGGQILGVDLREGDDDLVIDGAVGVVAITDAGDDYVTVLSGESMLLYLGAGNDRAKVAGGSHIRVIGGEGDDQFHVLGGELIDLDGGVGSDLLVVSDGSHITARMDNGSDRIVVFGGISMYLGAGHDDDHLLQFGSLGSALPAGQVYAVLDGQAGNDTLMLLPLLTSDARSELDPDSPLAIDPLEGLPAWIQLPDSITNPTANQYPSSVALVGGSGDDTLWLAGNIRQVGLAGDGDDTVHLLNGSSSVVSGGRGNDRVFVRSAGVDNYIFGDEGDDSLDIFDGTRTAVFGQDGEDTIRFFGGAQSFARSGWDDDQMHVHGGRDLIVSGEEGNDHLTVHGGTNILAAGGSGQDYLLVDGGNDVVLLGESGWDHLVFDGGELVNLSGGDGNDLLEAFERGGFLYGDDGDDSYRIFVTLGQSETTDLVLRELKFVDGGNYEPDARGSDTVDLSHFSTGVTFDLGVVDAIQELVPQQLSLMLIGAFENIVGTSGDDVLIGSALSNRLEGGAGNDILIGMGGDNVFIPGPGNNFMHGGSGDDQYVFATTAGQPLGTNTIYEAPGGGEDLLNFSGMPVGLSGFDMTSADAQELPDGMLTLFLRVSPTDDEVAEIENLIGTRFDDVVTGNELNNRFELLGGNDFVDGRGGQNVYVFQGGNLGSIFIADTPVSAGQGTLDFTAFDAPLMLDLELTTPQDLYGELSLTLASSASIANVVGTSFDDVILGNSLDNNIYGGAGSDYLDGRGGNDLLVADLPSIVFLDFDSAFNAERGDYSYSIEERNEIQSRVEQAFAAFNWQFTQDEVVARSWADRMGGSFVRLAFNEGRGGGVAGDAGEVDFRNISRRIVSQVNINALMGAIETIVLQQLGEEFSQQDFDQAKASLVVDLTATIAAHELGHTAGLRHSDAFGPIGTGVYEATDVSRYYPFYSGAFSAFETPYHTIASPASVGTSLLDAARATFFGPREAIKLAFNETGRTVREQGKQFGSHSTMQAAEDLGDLHPLYVPNLAPAEGFTYSGMKFEVSALAVVGELRADPNGNPANPADTEFDYYRFAARAGEWVNVELMSTSIRPLRGDPFDGELRLYDELGNLLAFNDDELETKDATLRDFLVPSDGVYYLRVGLSEQPAWPTTGGRYELFLTRFQAVPTEATLPASQGDRLVGGLGSNNVLRGGAADDLFLAVAGGSGDQIYGGRGWDTLDLLGLDYTYDLLDSVENVVNLNIAPTATLFGLPTSGLYLGDSFTVGFSDPMDPSESDTQAGFRYAFELRNQQGNLVSGSSELPELYDLASSETTLSLTVWEEGTLQLTARIFDQQSGYRDYVATILVFSTPLEGFITGPTVVQHGESAAYSVSITNVTDVSGANLRYSFGRSVGDLAPNYEAASSQDFASFTFSEAGEQLVYARVFKPLGDFSTWELPVEVVTTWVAADESAIQIDLPFDMDWDSLKLYAGPGNNVQPGLSLVGRNTGLVQGSVVWDEITQSLTFVKTGGPLVPDEYVLTLFSSPTGFRLMDGSLLDGNANGDPGGNFVYHFSVEAHQARVVSIPDFARGSGQVVNLKFDNAQPGMPVSISDGTDVVEVELDIAFNPELLDLWSTYVDTLPSDWTTTVTHVGSGRVRLHLMGQTPLGAGPQVLTRLLAGVPDTASYGATNLLTIENLQVITQGGLPIPALGDVALHQVVFIGDGNADGLYTAQDAAWIAGLAESYHTGFDAFTWIDPVIIADVNQDGSIDSADVQWLLRKALDPTLQPEIPDPVAGEFPSLGLTQTRITADLEVPVRPGEIVQIPLRMEQSALGLWAIDVTVDFDPQLLDLQYSADGLAAELAGAFLQEGGWVLQTYSFGVQGRVKLSFSRSSPSVVTSGLIAVLRFAASSEAPSGPVSIEIGGYSTVSPVNFEFRSGSIAVVAHAPTNLVLEQREVVEDGQIQVQDLWFGDLSTVDQDIFDRFLYELVTGDGDDDNFRFRIVDDQIYLAAGELLDYEVRPEYKVRVRATDLVGNQIEQAFVLTVTRSDQMNFATILGRYLFYNNSRFDGNSPEASQLDDSAIATDKAALLPGQTATLINYSSYSRGINGVMIDVQGLKDPDGIDLSDFEFRVGNSQSIAAWEDAPTPISISVRKGAGIDGSDRITIIWQDNAIEKQWLQVKVLVTEKTGLQQEDIHYWGNAIGETGDSSSHARVTATDEVRIRSNFSNNPGRTSGGIARSELVLRESGSKFKLEPALVDNLFDVNRDGIVDELDAMLARNNMTTFVNALRLISV